MMMMMKIFDGFNMEKFEKYLRICISVFSLCWFICRYHKQWELLQEL